MDQTCYIHNMDKTSMPLDHKQPKYIAPKGMKTLCAIIRKQISITIFACVNAVDTVLPPMVSFKVCI